MSRGLLALLSCAFVACRIGYEPLEQSSTAVGGGGPSTGGVSASAGRASGSSSNSGGAEAGGTDVGGTDVGGTDVGGTDVGGTDVGGTDVGGTDAGGSATAGSSSAGDTSVGGTAGSSAGGTGGSSGGGSGGSQGCTPVSEVCDGLDNDCSGTADDGGVCSALCEGATYGGHSYLFCTGLLTWAAAEADCEAQGMRLVRIDDVAELDWVGTVAFAAEGTNNSTTVWRWLGANDISVDGEWRWVDGEQFWQGTQTGMAVGGLYEHWANFQPLAKDDCAMMQNTNGTPYWNAMDCTLTNPYVCELY
jgi:hypothetical protein